jgi:hypothetical protein
MGTDATTVGDVLLFISPFMPFMTKNVQEKRILSNL